MTRSSNHKQSEGIFCRNLSVEDAVELARRSIYHATFRDAVSGGTVSGNLSLPGHLHSGMRPIRDSRTL